MKAYSYVRFSTPEQAQGDSLRRQIQAAADFARRHRLTLDTELTFADSGVSAFRGANAKKGALRAFLRAVEDELVETPAVLILENLDRMSRRAPWEALPVLQEIINTGVALGIPTKDKIIGLDELRGASGAFVLMEVILDLQRAHEESETKSRRLKAAWGAKRDRVGSEVLTRRVPAWITVVDGQPELIKERAAIVQRIFKMFLAGQGKGAIANGLNTQRVPTFGRAEYWHPTYILKILRNPAVIGTLTPHTLEYEDGRKVRVAQDPVPDYFPAAIDEDTWQRAQALLAAGTPTRGRPGKVRNILAGLARCPRCGSTMTRVTKGSGKKAGQPFLVCVKAKTGAGCSYRTVKISDVEHALRVNAQEIPSGRPSGDEDLRQQIDAVDHELYETGVLIEDAVDLLLTRKSAALSKRLAKLEARSAQLKATYDELTARAAESEPKVVKHRAERLRAALSAPKLDRQAVNTAMRECFSHVVVNYTRGVLECVWRHGPSDEIPFMWPKEG